MKKKRIVELLIDETEEIQGIKAISLVANPAIERGWVALSKDRFLSLAKVNDEKGTLVGVALIPEKEIPRYDQDANEEYLVFFSKETIEKIKRYTDRPIVIREKPRGRGTSGPSEATVPLSEDLKDAWVCVTSCSIAAVEAQCMGIPVICDEKSFAKEVGGQELADIENPYFVGCEDWLYSLAYQQFTPEEIANGKAVEILMDKGLL